MRNRYRRRRPRPAVPDDDIRWSGGGAATIERVRLDGGTVAERVRYDWRGRNREVFVGRDPVSIDELLRRNWHRMSRGVTVDIEYHKQSHEPAVVSISIDDELAILWHRPQSYRRLPAALGRLLTTTAIPKIGVGLDDDLWKLAASTDFLSYGWPRGILDLQTLYRSLCRDRDPSKPVSLTEIVNSSAASSSYCTKPFVKRPHDGNFGRDALTPDQVVYAAGDVFATWQAVGGLGLDDPSPITRKPEPTVVDDAKQADMPPIVPTTITDDRRGGRKRPRSKDDESAENNETGIPKSSVHPSD